MKRSSALLLIVLQLAAFGCASRGNRAPRLIPAEEFTKAYHAGRVQDYSFLRAKDAPVAQGILYGDAPLPAAAAAAGQFDQNRAFGAQRGTVMPVRPLEDPQDSRASLARAEAPSGQPDELVRAQFGGDPRYLAQGFHLIKSAHAPSPQIPVQYAAAQQQFSTHGGAAPGASVPGQYPYPPTAALAGPPPGSAAPYYLGQMRDNPSLWPDEAQGAFLFTDHRAHQAMDVVTITIQDSTKGKKSAETETESEFSLTAGIAEFFGIETKKWISNNESLDPAELINATTNTTFEGEGETEREGSLSGQISAVIMEVLPNGLFRIEGTKIVSLNSEEEVMVISGLIRSRDITSDNRVDSNRIANMRIDLYGRGVLAEQQQPGWGARIFEAVWPF